jgi:hypothetical protein
MGLSSAYRQTARKIIPITMQVAIRAGCSDVRDKIGNITGFARNCDLNVSPAELKEVAAALRSDPAVLADLRYQYRFCRFCHAQSRWSREEPGRGAAALGAAPGAAEKEAP